MKVRTPSLLPLLLLSFACASTHYDPGTQSTRDAFMNVDASKNPDLATVYIYREGHFVGSGLRPTVMLGDDDLVNIRSGSFYVGRFPAGPHRFRMDDAKSGADVDLKPGATYYFKVNIVPGVWKGSGQILMVAPEQGGYEIRQTRPIDAQEIPDKSHTPESLLVPFAR